MLKHSKGGERKKRDEKMVVFNECEGYRNIIYNICDSSGFNRDIDVDGYEDGIRGGWE